MTLKKIINYKRVVQSVAMNKHPNQSGLSLKIEAGDVIKLEAINPKLNEITSHLKLEVPIEELDNLIGALTELKIELNK